MSSSPYLPERNDIVFIDFEPTKGKEIGKYRLALILTSREYNQKTGLIICCPISTSIRGHLTEVPINNLDKPSVVAASLIHTMSWKSRKTKFITKAKPNVLKGVLSRLLPLLGGHEILQ